MTNAFERGTNTSTRYRPAVTIKSLTREKRIAVSLLKKKQKKKQKKTVALIVTSHAQIELDTLKRPPIYYEPMRAALFRSVLSREFRLINRSTWFDVTSQFGQVWSEKPNPRRGLDNWERIFLNILCPKVTRAIFRADKIPFGVHALRKPLCFNQTFRIID